jgi:site-specific recombinase XerD
MSNARDLATKGDTGELAARRDVARLARLFEDWLAALSPATRRNYGSDLDAFAAHFGAPDRCTAAVLLCGAPSMEARDLVLRFKTASRDKGEAPGTVNRRLSALRSLYKHAAGAPLVIASVKAARRRKVHNGNGATVSALLSAAAAGGGVKALRDAALVATLHDSGLRRSEAATLRLADLDLEARTAYVRGKGRQGEREPVDLSVPAVEALRAYLVARPGLSADAPVFASLDRAHKGSGALTADAIHAIIGKLGDKAGLAHKIAPHDLRRAGARSLAKAGADAESLRRWGRWADYRTPARYVGEVAEKGREAVDMLARLRAMA